MKRTPTIVSIGLACTLALVSLPAPASAGETNEQEIEIAPPNLEAFAWPTNVLTIDSKTGLITNIEDHGANLTDFRVTGVEVGGAGYTLSDPLGRPVFRNQPATTDGTVEFWYTQLIPGSYTVTRGSQNEVITRIFVPMDLLPTSVLPPGPTPSPEPAPLSGTSSSSSKTGGSTQAEASKSNNYDTCAASPRYDYLESTTLWTPLIIAHAPHGGSATASTQSSKARGLMIAAFGWSSGEWTSSNVPAGSGESKASAALAKWGRYARYDYNCHWNFRGYTTKVIDWKPTGYRHDNILDLTNSPSTGADDKTSTCVNGYCSVYVDHRYKGRDAEQSTSGGSTSRCIGTNSFGQFGGGVSFSGGYVGFEVVKFHRDSGSSLTYCYSFPQGGTWRIDYQNGANDGWAFCRPSLTSCA